MGTTEQTEELTKKFYDEVCSTLNMDQLSSEEAWINYIQTKNNFTLEVQSKLNIFLIFCYELHFIGRCEDNYWIKLP